MSDEFLEILPRLLDPRSQDDGLLTPIARLQEVVSLEQASHPEHRECRPERLGVIP